MLLAVAGLDDAAVPRRTRQLAGGDWSRFTPAERAAFAFARKQSRAPASITDEDVEELVRHFGPERALDVIWWACRCHYMTRVADGFQLPLERENVFRAPASSRRPMGRAASSSSAFRRSPAILRLAMASSRTRTEADCWWCR